MPFDSHAEIKTNDNSAMIRVCLIMTGSIAPAGPATLPAPAIFRYAARDMKEDGSAAANGHEANEPRVVLAADRKTPRWRKVLPFAGLVLLIWLLSRLHLGDMSAALGRVTFATLLLSSAAFTINMLIKALRWQRMLAVQGI